MAANGRTTASLHNVLKRYTTSRSNRPRAVATARKSHARAPHARNNFCRAHGTRERTTCGGGRSVGVAR
eukprot:8556099-Lingulodinium_polyedra.AAC.1